MGDADGAGGSDLSGRAGGDRPRGRPSASAWLTVGLAVALAAALRLWGIGDQVVLGDELHTAKTALRSGVGAILTTYLPADPCLPLTALARLYLEAGWPLTEGLLRWPALLAGILTVGLLPLLLARELGWLRTALWALLLASSPALVYYSRIGRPYALIALLAPLALIAFWRFWEKGGAGAAVGYAAAGAGAAWLHLGTAPFVAAPLAFAAAELAVRGRHLGRDQLRRRLGRLVTAGTALALLVAAFLLPALRSFLRLLRQKSGTGAPPDLSTVTGVLTLEAGSGLPWAVVLFWVLAVIGVLVLGRRTPRPMLLVLTASAAQWLAMTVVARPQGVALPLVLHRYLLPVLPPILLAVAAGLAWLAGRGRLGPVLAGGALVALLAVHPYLADPALRLGPWAGSSQAADLVAAPPELPRPAVPAPYGLLAREPGSQAVVEAPSAVAWWASGGQIARWRVHRRPVILATVKPWVADPRLGFRTLVPATPRAVAASGGRFAAVTLDPIRARRLADPEQAQRGTVGPTPPSHPQVRAARLLVDRFEGAWGPPHLTGDGVVVWDLVRIEAAVEAEDR